MKTIVDRIIDAQRDREMNELKVRMDGHSGLIRELNEETDRLTHELVVTRIALAIACVGLTVAVWQFLAAPIMQVAGMECRL